MSGEFDFNAISAKGAVFRISVDGIKSDEKHVSWEECAKRYLSQ